jgi:pimeloyl-ACP methyl ester carboxylesterase
MVSPADARGLIAPRPRLATRAVERVGAGLVTSFDRAFGAWALRTADHGRVETLSADARVAALQQSMPRYDAAFQAGREAFFPEPPIPDVRTQPAGLRFGKPAFDLTWHSGYAPFCPTAGSRYLSHAENHVAHARLFSRPGDPRPVVLLLHGYLTGPYRLEERLWPVRWLLARGLDVVLPVLPHHGPRKGKGRPPFPDADPRFTVEGFRQAVGDLRGLIGWLLARGAPAVGAVGMSLGGYTSALLATIDARLDFVIPMIPLASIADFAQERGKLAGAPHEHATQHALLEQIYRVVSPLHAPPKVPRDGRMVIAAAQDQICPVRHAERLAEHFEVELLRFYGGHMMQLGRADAWRRIGRFLGERGLLGRQRSLQVA